MNNNITQPEMRNFDKVKELLAAMDKNTVYDITQADSQEKAQALFDANYGAPGIEPELHLVPDKLYYFPVMRLKPGAIEVLARKRGK